MNQKLRTKQEYHHETPRRQTEKFTLKWAKHEHAQSFELHSRLSRLVVEKRPGIVKLEGCYFSRCCAVAESASALP